MSPRSTALAVALATTFAACGGGSDFHPLAPRPHPMIPRMPDSVEIILVPTTAKNPVEVGVIKATSSAHPPTGDGLEDVLERLRKSAGDHGCDAIVLSTTEESLFATSNGTPLYRTHQSARCFVYP